MHVLFKQWFGDGLLLHYYQEVACKMPVHHDIFSQHSIEKPVAVYGHFNRRRNFGVEDYYPQAKQFITILRDPLERLISHYCYIQKVAHDWKKHPKPIDPDFQNYVRTNRSVMLNYFPRVVTFGNYKEIIEQYFIEIGIMEDLEASMQRIAQKLHKPLDQKKIEHINATERSEAASEALRYLFIENNELEYTVYNYVKNRFTHKNEEQPHGI